MRISALGINVQSNGISDAAQQLKNLAEASKQANSEVSKLSTKTEKLNSTMTSASVDKYSDSVSKQATGINSAISALSAYENSLNRLLAAQKQISKSSFEINEALMVQTKSTAELSKKKEELANKIDGASKSGSLFNNTLRSMASAAAAYISLNFAKEAIQTADGWVMAQSKLSLALGTMRAAKSVQEELFQSAQALRSPLESMTQLYNRMTVPMMALGKSGKETMQVVEGVAAALKLSGATGAEASSVMLQFSQSMNAGRLNGGEFNAVAEGAPIILRAIEKELKAVGKGAELSSSGLKKMAADGKLTMDIVAPAIAKMGQVWKEQLESMPITVDAAMERIKNSWTRELGKLNEDTKFTEGLAKAISSIEQILPSLAQAVGTTMSFVANHFEGIKTVLTSLLAMGVASWFGGIVAAVSPAITVLGTATSVVSGLGAALTALNINPWILGFTALVGVGTALYMNLKDQNSELELQNKIRDKLMDQSSGAIKAMDAEIDRIKTQINLQREKIGLSRIYQDDLDKQTEKEIKTKISTQEQAVKAAQESLRIAQATYDNKTKPQAGRLNIGGASEKEIMDLRDATVKLDKAQKDLNESLFKQQQLETYRFAQAENQVKVNSATAMNAAISATQNKHTQKAIELQEKLSNLRRDYIGERGADSEFAKQELALKKAIAEEEKKALGHQEKIKSHHYERLDVVSKEAVIRQQLEEQMAIWAKTSLEDDDKLLESTKRRIKAETQLEQFKGKTLNKLDLETKAKIEQELIDIRMTEKIEARNRSEADYRKNAKILLQEGQTALEKESKQLEVLKKQYEERETREESAIKVTLDGLEAELKLWEVLEIQQQGLSQVQEEHIKKLKERVAVLKESLNLEDKLQQRKEDDKRQKELDKAAKEYENKWEAANKRIADGLYESLTGGFGNFTKKLGKDLKEWAFRLVLNPVIQPIAAFGASLLYPNAAGAANVMGAAGGGNSFGGIMQGISNLGGLIKGGFGSMIGSGLSTLAGWTGSSTLAGMAMGAQGAGAGVVAPELLGAASAGSMLSTAMPYIGAAMLLYQGLKGGEKQTTGQWLEANLGTNDLKRVQTWEKQNGFLRGNESGKYFWDLASSTTTVDGRKYTDEKGMQGDKAMFQALKDGYDAIKKANEAYAKSLGLNADFIKDRTDYINFQYGKTAEETQAALEKAFKEVNDNIASKLLVGLEGMKKSGESSSDTLKRLSDNVTTVNLVLDKLGYSMVQLDINGIKAAQSLVDSLGGLQQFTAITSNYYQNYYSQQEKVSLATQALTKEFESLGYALPSSKEELRKLIDQAKALGTEAGDKTFAALLKLTGAFAELHPELEKAAKAVDNLSQQQSLHVEILKLQGKEQEALSLARKLELDKADEAIKPFLLLKWGLEDQKSKSEAAASAMEKANQARAAEIERVKQVEEEIVKANQARFEEAKAKAKDAYDVLQKSIGAEKDKLKSELDVQMKALKEQYETKKTAIDQQIKSITDFSSKLREVIGKLDSALKASVVDSPELSRQQRLAAIRNLGSANISNIMNNPAFDKTLEALGKPSEDFYSDFTSYLRDQAYVAATLTQLKDDGVVQLTNAEQQVKLLEEQKAQLELQFNMEQANLQRKHEEQMNKFDAQLEAAKAQLDALNGVNTSVLSVAQALSAFTQAMAAAAAAKSGGGGGGGGSSSGGSTGVVTKPSTGGGTTTPTVPTIPTTPTIPSQNIGLAEKFQEAREKLLESRLTDSFLQSIGYTEAQIASARSQTVGMTGGGSMLTALGGTSLYGKAISTLYDALRAEGNPLVNPDLQPGVATPSRPDGYDYDAIRKALAQVGISAFADGGNYEGGMALVGEEGAELINFNRSGRVYNAKETSEILSSSRNAGNSESVESAIKDLKDITRVLGERQISLLRDLTRISEKWDGDGLPETRQQ